MSKARRGNIFTRTEGGAFYCQWYVNGRQFVKVLRDAKGEPITEERAARKAADAMVRPYTAKDTAQLRQEAVNALRSATEEAQAAEAAARPRLPLSELWDRHPYTVNTRGTTERKLSENSVRDFKALWERFTVWAEGRGIRHAEDVTRAHTEAFRRELGDSGLSADRVNKVFLTARVMFRAAGMDPNPFDGFRKLAHKANGRRELTEPELRAVCGSATGELRSLLAIGLYTGLRLGDACQLDWTEVAPDLSRIIREPSKTHYKGSELVIPIHPVLRAILAELPRGKGPVLPETCAAYRANVSTVVRRIGKHFEDNGIRLHKPGTGEERDPETGKVESTGRRAVVEVGYHSLRHSFVSLAARQGVPLHVIQALCGHSTPAVQRLYLHNTDADTRKAIASLPAVTGDAEALPAPADPDRQELGELVKSLPAEAIGSLLTLARTLANPPAPVPGA